jgi:DNA-binding transcriptional ArsR family regulator
MAEKYLLFSLEDEKAKKLGEVISNPTCKKIVNLLADREMSVSELARELGVPLNTVDYNVKKLVDSGMIERASKWWSVKGKKIDTYKVANKLIVISPKKSSNVYSKLAGIVPVLLISAILTMLIFFYSQGSLMGFAKSETRAGELKSIENAPATSEAGGAASTATATAGASGASEKSYAKDVSDEANLKAETSPAGIGSSGAWQWFLIGSITAIVAFMIWKWKKL